MLFPILAALLPAFSVPDTSAWHYRLELSATAEIMIPGADDFYNGNSDVFGVNNTIAIAAGGAFRFTAHTPERRNVSALVGLGFGERELSWSREHEPFFGATENVVVVARMKSYVPVLELIAGAEYHPWRRHFFGVEVVLPIQIGDGDLKYEMAQSVLHPATSSNDDLVAVHSGTAPSSFRQAVLPRVMLTYDYRLFDRIDLGLGISPIYGDYFAETPEADIDSVGRIRLEHGGNGPWIEMHVGWTFGRAEP